MLAMMLLTALPCGVVLTAPPDPPGPHLPARPGPIRAPALGQAIVSPRRRQPQRDGALTGPSVPLGQSELIIGTERIVGREDVGKAFRPCLHGFAAVGAEGRGAGSRPDLGI